MTLAKLIARLDRAGFDLDAEQLLDALWLASLGRDLSIGSPHGSQSSIASPGEGHSTEARSVVPSAPQRAAQLPPTAHAAYSNFAPAMAPSTQLSPSTSIFARGKVPSSETHVNASPVALPAPQMLSDRLGLMRALRPLAQRWPSTSADEIDEEGTVEAFARTGARHPVVPIFRARGERWFEVALVLEDDASVELWADMLREFAGVLRDSGIFRAVGVWRLRTKNPPSRSAYLENAGGARIPTEAFLGKAVRRLIIFASNGASAKWSDGRYSEVLGPWMRDNAVLLLQLSAPSRWVRSRLGEPHGLAWTTVPGAHAISLRVDGEWWRMPQPAVGETLVPLPVIELTPSSLGQWAAMQMARGRHQPAYLLKLTQPGHAQAAAPRARQGITLSIERIVASLQYEFPDSLRLATLLSTAPFTVSVARLVQAIEFQGSTDPAMLAELMRSGMVVDVSRLPGSDATMAATFFRVRPEAARQLQRALRRSEAAELGREVQRRVSAHLATLTGSTVRSLELIADEAGRLRLPVWAQPFAHVATSLLGLPDTVQATQERFQRCIDSLTKAEVPAIAVLAAANRLSREHLPPALWTRLSTYGLVYQSTDGTWAFAPGVRELFGAMRPSQAPCAVEARAVLVALDMLQSMALAFHVGQLSGVRIGLYGIFESLPHWTKERAAALTHWVLAAEGLFAGPVSHVLATGHDPVEDGCTDADREALRKMLDACDEAMVDQLHSDGYADMLAELRLAVRLLARRRPRLFEEVLIPFIEDEIRRFIDESVTPDDERRWRDDARVTTGWLRNDDVMQAVAPYMSPFFQRFGRDGWSDLVLSDDYPAYLEAIFAIWRDAAGDLLSVNKDPLTVLEIAFPIDADSIGWMRANMPSIDIRGSENHASEVWTLPAVAYIELIGELGAILLSALRRRLARGRWQPKAMWVHGRPENSMVERTLMLHGFDLEYTAAASTAEARLLSQHSLFDVVILNMGQSVDSRADYTLIDDLRSQQNTVPFVIYSSGQQPQYLTEALQHGAIGTTDSMEGLPRLVLEALLRYDDTLARRFGPDLLLTYTERRFPGLGTSSLTNWHICRDIDESEFATLLDIDRAMDAASGALTALMLEKDGLFPTGTDCLAAGLYLTSQQFRRVHALPAEIKERVARHALRPPNEPTEVRNRTVNDDGEHKEYGEPLPQRLARRLAKMMADAEAPALYAQLESALGYAVEEGNWLVDADSYLSVESDDVYGQLVSWQFLKSGSAMFTASNHVDGTLSVNTGITLVVEIHSTFNFSVTDSIDKDQVSLGSTNASRRVSTTVDVDMSVTGIEEGDPQADSIDVETIAMEVNFGNVEPNDWESDDQ